MKQREEASPKVSVVIATHNRANLIEEAVRSILTQTFQSFEVLIVDDFSSDDTPAVLAGLKRTDDRIRIFRTKDNVGPGTARNLGITEAQGEYIAVLDDDDIAMPHRLETQVRVLESDHSIGCVFSCVGHFSDDPSDFTVYPPLLQSGKFPQEPDELFKLLYVERNLIQNTTFTSRAAILKEFLYPAQPWGPEDLIMCLKMCAKGVKMVGLPEVLVKMRVRPGKSLMSGDPGRVLRARREAIQVMQKWLREEGVGRYDALHRIAWARQFAREARARGGPRGLITVLAALAYAPRDEFVWNTMMHLISRARSKTQRFFTGGRRFPEMK